MLNDPQCPRCSSGRLDEIDYSIGGEAIYCCDSCGAVVKNVPEGGQEAQLARPG